MALRNYNVNDEAIVAAAAGDVTPGYAACATTPMAGYVLATEANRDELPRRWISGVIIGNASPQASVPIVCSGHVDAAQVPDLADTNGGVGGYVNVTALGTLERSDELTTDTIGVMEDDGGATISTFLQHVATLQSVWQKVSNVVSLIGTPTTVDARVSGNFGIMAESATVDLETTYGVSAFADPDHHAAMTIGAGTFEFLAVRSDLGGADMSIRAVNGQMSVGTDTTSPLGIAASLAINGLTGEMTMNTLGGLGGIFLNTDNYMEWVVTNGSEICDIFINGNIFHVTMLGSSGVSQVNFEAEQVKLQSTLLPMMFGTPTQTTVGAAGLASALPGAPKGYFHLVLPDATEVVVPYWLAS